ncbi:Vps62-related protein [Pseudomonas sp. N40(2020)]|uniref:Vps62-related protein n=1 Tax=Pseudomonas sp. N40(2020) TaxID=2767798 RepID=UPI001656F44E|nr:Vps62-related protein [Pseudomonas sp. N40(2020)]MBC8997478.1 Vps62-related protein [Pseudomonas sp. N40(2020)]
MTTDEQITSSAGRMNSIKIDNLLINFTTEFLRIWDTSGLQAKPAAFWHPTPAPDLLPGYFPLGDVASVGHGNINGTRVVAVVCEADTPSTDPAKGKALCRPDDYQLIWKDSGSGSKRDLSIWKPIPPDGYVALGSVCSSDHEKPSFNAVRCVREDLVIASSGTEPVWNDKSSGARQSVSVWTAVPPAAASGEIHLAPGTFTGFSGYSRPANAPVYSLRMQIPLQVNPQPTAPVLCGETPALAEAADKPTYTVRLPWFAVKDPQLPPLEQLRLSPFYLLERTDQYVLVGHGHNTDDQSKTFRWTSPRAQRTASLRTFTHITSVEFGAQWQTSLPNPLLFSARLSHDFTQCEIHANEWLNTAAIDVVAVVDKNRSVAVYLKQSDYRLMRADGTPVTGGFSYTDGASLHISQYTPAEPEVTVVAQQEPEVEMDTRTPGADNDVIASPPEPDLPSATDTAP